MKKYEVIDASNLEFKNHHELNDDEVKASKKVFIYRSKTKASSQKHFVGPAKDLVPKSDTIPSDFFPALSKFKGIVSIGRTLVDDKHAFRNIHLYTSLVDNLDGYERICYVSAKPGDQFVRVKENGRSRGDNYSAYYQLLKLKLEEKRFGIDRGEFIVPVARAEEFVKIVNDINEMAIRKDLVLVLDKDTQYVNHNLFNIVYWMEKSLILDSNSGEYSDMKKELTLNELQKQFVSFIDKQNEEQTFQEIQQTLNDLNQYLKLKQKFLS